jgi:uncharacterized protein
MARVLAFLLLFAAVADAQTIRVAAESMADEPLAISIEGLQPRQPAIMRATLDDAGGVRWQSWSGFIADANGRGTVGDMIGSMDVAGADRGRKRFATRGFEPQTVQLSLEVDGKAIATAAATRRFLSDGVIATPIREPGITGTFFKPAAPTMGVLVLGGSEGGVGDEGVAALLASRGYATLALQYFEGTLADIPLETFHRALDWLATQSGVQGLAIVGTSKGAEAALLIAARRVDVTAVVVYAPSSVVWSCICDSSGASSWTEGGTPLPFVAQRRDPTYAPPQGFPIEPGVHYEYRLRHREPAARIPVEKIEAELLLIAGANDRMWPSAAMAREIAARKKARLLILPGAGHLIGKALLPAGSTLVGNGRIETGGTPNGNAAAQPVAWEAVLRFLSAARDRGASGRSRARR